MLTFTNSPLVYTQSLNRKEHGIRDSCRLGPPKFLPWLRPCKTHQILSMQRAVHHDTNNQPYYISLVHHTHDPIEYAQRFDVLSNHCDEMRNLLTHHGGKLFHWLNAKCSHTTCAKCLHMVCPTACPDRYTGTSFRRLRVSRLNGVPMGA